LKRFHAIDALTTVQRQLAVEVGILFGSRQELSEFIDYVERKPGDQRWSGVERALVARWGEFLPDDATRAIRLVPDLPLAAIELAATDHAWGAAEAAIFVLQDESIEPAVVASFVETFSANLGHPDALAGAAAERVVVRASELAAAWRISPERDRVEAAIAGSARAFSTHERQGVMHAAINMLGRARGPGPISAWLDRAGPERSAFVAALRSGRDLQCSRLRAWEYLSRAWAASACADRLKRSMSDVERHAMLDSWWLAWSPARRASLSRSKLGASVWPGAASEDPSMRRAAFLMAKQCTPDAKELSAACESALVDPDTRVRLAATGVAPIAVLRDFAFDACEEVARSALLRISAVGESRRTGIDDSWAEVLARSPHESVRLIARGERIRSVGSGLPYPVRAADARPRATELPAALASRWDEADSMERAAVLRLARRAGLEAVLAGRLIEAVRNGEAGDPSVSAAVSALAGVKGRDAADAIAEALTSRDPRVRSNAIEAVARRERSWGESPAWLSASLLELKDDQHHRVRASTLRAMFVRAVAGAHGDSTRGIVAAGVLGLVQGRGFEPVAGLWLADRLLGISRIDASWRGELIESARRLSGESGRAGARARGIVQRYDEQQEPDAAYALAA